MGCLHSYLPILTMVLVQLGFAGMNITSKLAMDAGMKPQVIVTYPQIFAPSPSHPSPTFLKEASGQTSRKRSWVAYWRAPFVGMSKIADL
uniref:Uncharacterized protein n=1 Tax=Kalanchoe fedtschenkoi TaxID=63787 RepID=A0A7N0T1L3_KALFE